jgi:hypothetical protein
LLFEIRPYNNILFYISQNLFLSGYRNCRHSKFILNSGPPVFTLERIKVKYM